MAQTELFIIKTVTAGLITDPERDVKIFHRTAQEYFDDNWRDLFPKTEIDIATTVLTYLNFDALPDPSEGSEDDAQVDLRLEKSSFFA